jgi:excisionase family DNA binding protein
MLPARAGKHEHSFGLTKVALLAYHSAMAHDETNQPPEHDPLTTGELISLQEAAKYAGLSKHSLLTYARNGRLKAKKIGSQWTTTRAAIDEYLRSRDLDSIPKKYRKST